MLTFEGADLVRKRTDICLRQGDLGSAASAVEGAVVVIERVRRLGETGLGLGDCLLGVEQTADEVGDGAVVVCELVLKPGHVHLVRHRSGHEGSQVRFGQRCPHRGQEGPRRRPGRCRGGYLVIAGWSCWLWGRAVEAEGGGGLVGPGAGYGVGDHLGGCAFVLKHNEGKASLVLRPRVSGT